MIEPLNYQEIVQRPELRRYPSLAQFSRQSKKEFVSVLEQYLDDDPGITVNGKYYEDQGGFSATMALNAYLTDNQNITASYTKVTDTLREMEKQIDKLVG